MTLQTLRRLAALLLLLLSVGLLVWSSWPARTYTRSLVFLPGDMRLPASATGGEPGAAIPEQRVAILEWPARVWTGDVAPIRLVFGVGEQDTGADAGQTPSLYDTYQVRAEARLEMIGLYYDPLGEISQAVLPGRPVVFMWNLRAGEAGIYPADVWLHLHYIPKSGGSDSRQVLTAQRIEIQAIDFLGLSGSWLRALCSAGIAAGMVFGLDGLLARVLQIFWKSTGDGHSSPGQ